MYKKKVISIIMSVMIAFTCFIVPSNTYAAESHLLKDQDNINVVYDMGADFKELEPVEVDIPHVESQEVNKVSFTIEDKIKEMESTPLITGSASSNSDAGDMITTSAVTNGSVSDYLSGTGEGKLYSITIDPTILFQAKLIQPNNSGIDYNLYIFDSTCTTILDGSENITYINSDGTTIDESVGVINQSSAAETYYIFVYSSQGGSINEAFTLEYAISYPYDNFETDEHPSVGKNITYVTSGGSIASRSISSSVDSDWYVINVPSKRCYDKINFNISTTSNNACKVEVYQDMSSGNFQMNKLLADGGNVSVSAGQYYIKVSYNGNSFDSDDVQNYKLLLTPILTPQKIVWKGYNSDMGPDDYPSGYYYGTHYRAKGFLDMIGRVTATDPETGIEYGVPYTSVTGTYTNAAWYGNEANRVRTGIGITDSAGYFVVHVALAPAVGSLSQYITVSTHYYDYCDILVNVTGNSSVKFEDNIYHFAYSIWGGLNN